MGLANGLDPRRSARSQGAVPAARSHTHISLFRPAPVLVASKSAAKARRVIVAALHRLVPSPSASGTRKRLMCLAKNSSARLLAQKGRSGWPCTRGGVQWDGKHTVARDHHLDKTLYRGGMTLETRGLKSSRPFWRSKFLPPFRSGIPKWRNQCKWKYLVHGAAL
jgi:hypothetical protein